MENRDTGAPTFRCVVSETGTCKKSQTQKPTPTPTLRFDAFSKATETTEIDSRDSVEDERAPRAVRAPDERVLVQVRDVIRAHGRACFFFGNRRRRRRADGDGARQIESRLRLTQRQQQSVVHSPSG